MKTFLFAKKSTISKKIIDWINTNFVSKAICILITWIVISIPFNIYLLLRWAIGPEGFWQEIAFIVVSILLLGWIQGFLLIAGIYVTLAIMMDDL